ncbi:hypothetical protein ED733_003928 [Metarhizium rileyi]|uniref:Uncharacterized protein n=1 Tax=Metarhizium rileyi (strain RCEF 4871) TaxID=1649241 RepID=A0A5C6GBH0_METRR|nr:hypothetical protein ED733_003928 [Metarhizium rileyi]
MSMSMLLVCALLGSAAGNVEKLVFTGPPPSIASPALPPFQLNTLTHDDLSVRTALDRIFASGQTGHGHSSWLLLTNLTQSQRYELRVCWSALEPTRFDMEAYTLDAVLEKPKLLRSLSSYMASRPGAQTEKQLSRSSSLLVEIHAAADYFTDDARLMDSPPPVLVDLILDPFLFNVVPQSLLPTLGYLALLSITTWFVARRAASRLRSVADQAETPVKKQD